MANRGRYCRRAGSEIDRCWHLSPSITCVKFLWNPSNGFEVINKNVFQNGRHNIKLPIGGARIGVTIPKSTGVGVSRYVTFVLSFVSLDWAVFKIIIGNQSQIYDTKWPPGGARIGVVIQKPTGVGPSRGTTFVQSLVTFRPAVSEINAGNELWTDGPTDRPPGWRQYVPTLVWAHKKYTLLHMTSK